MKRTRSRQIIFSLMFLVFGFMFSFSYQLTKDDSDGPEISSKQWERDLNLRNQIIQLEEKNRNLQYELNEKQMQIQEIEKEFAEEEQLYFNLAEDAEKFRMYLGKMKVKGSGVQVTLADGEYNPLDGNVNNYIVHEHHVFKVINELYISGASAIAVNGQRLTHNSYIICNGPVIEIDGYQHPAPFVITAIGDEDVMSSALNIAGGVKDALVQENIMFTLEKMQTIMIDPLL